MNKSTVGAEGSGNQGAGARPPLLPALDAPIAELDTGPVGRLAYYADASVSGRPLLLIHSINAAPSSFEMKPLFEHYRGGRPVFSLDLPGFGHSERADRRYSPELFADAIRAMLEQVICGPTDLIALSLSCEFAARAAIAVPGLVSSLTLISPTGFGTRAVPPAWVGRVAYAALNRPLWRQGLYDLVASRRSIRYYLGKSFVGGAPQAMIDYAYATSHQPGARCAPLYFLSSQLFTLKAMDRLYARVGDLPVLALADRDPYVTFEQLPAFAAAHPKWDFETVAPHMGLPHWERPQAACAALERLWGRS
jgi:pimeloyl-ACP methyl ester carboxylesterase